MEPSATALFPKGEKAPAEYFTGTAWVKALIPNDNALHCLIGDVVFEPGTRNNWHSHPGGQVLLCTAGTGYYQERGRPTQLLKKGDVVQIPQDVIHWHGATPDCEFTHISVVPNIQFGGTVWMEPVTDKEYNSFKYHSME